MAESPNGRDCLHCCHTHDDEDSQQQYAEREEGGGENEGHLPIGVTRELFSISVAAALIATWRTEAATFLATFLLHIQAVYFSNAAAMFAIRLSSAAVRLCAAMAFAFSRSSRLCALDRSSGPSLSTMQARLGAHRGGAPRERRRWQWRRWWWWWWQWRGV